MKKLSFAQSIQNQIKEQKIIPKSRFQFIFKNYTIWTMAIISILLGSFALSTLYFILTDNDWDVINYLDRSLLEHIVISLPYLWIVALGGLIFITSYSMHHTTYGYRYMPKVVISLTLVISFLLGTVLVVLGFDNKLHNTLLNQIPLYKELIYTKNDTWIYPERGLLSGTILKTHGEQDFEISDLGGTLWNVHMVDDVDLDDGVKIIPTTKIKLIGKIRIPNAFDVFIIRPWGR